MTFYDWMFEGIGMIGVLCFLTAYGLLQAGKLSIEDMRYSVINLVGAVLVGISLLWRWNFSAFMLEAAWALISIYGIAKQLAKRRQRSHE